MKSRLQLEEVGKRILNQSRTELYMAMHFMARALDSLGYTMDLNTRRCGTDARTIHYNPQFLFHLFIESPQKLDRLYLHMILHCLFRHMFTGDGRDTELWNLACDIQTESVLDSMNYEIIRRPPGAFREEWYQRLTAEVKVLTAERLYQYFLENRIDPDTRERLKLEFLRDDHAFWAPLSDKNRDPEDNDGAPDMSELPPMQGDFPEAEPDNAQKEDRRQQLQALPSRTELDESWKEQAEKMETELETFGREQSEESGTLHWLLRLQCRQRTDYRDFLRRISIDREESRIDPDSFDYGYYSYGLSLYGNMPLIEENEFTEVRKVEQLVIAIDTSASCKDSLVQRFLNETAGLLADRNGFFRKVQILILECDEHIQRELWISDTREMQQYAGQFRVSGGFGTDFRPVFSRVQTLREQEVLPRLRGLLYFTDGFGSYPERPTDYLTGFVYPENEGCGDEKTPKWAMKLYMKQEVWK